MPVHISRLLHHYFFVAVLGLVCSPALGVVPVFGYQVVAKFPHSTANYTEGFFYLNGLFYEGTGLQGHSEVLAIEPETGKALQHVDVPSPYFGEGIVDWGPNILEWTWQSHTGLSWIASRCEP